MSPFKRSATRRSLLRAAAAKLSAGLVGAQALAAGARATASTRPSASAATLAGSVASTEPRPNSGDVDLLAVIPAEHHAFIRNGNSSHDVAGDLRRALASLGTRGGTVRVPPGVYRLGAPVELPPRTRLVGSGRTASVFEVAHDGDGLRATAPINSWTAVNIGLHSLGIICRDNRASRGAAFRDVGGTYVDLHDVWVSGFRYGVVLDQTEIATLDRCQLEYARETCLWLVNGPDASPGAKTTYTNRITVSRCQINQADGYGVVDDGGRAHSFRDNNFNGCRRGHLRIAGYGEYLVDGNYFEEAGGPPITISNRTLGGRNVQRPNSVLLSANLVIARSGLPAVVVEGATALTLTGNTLVGERAPSVRGVNTAESVFSEGNAVQNPAGLFDDTRGYRRHRSAELGGDLFQRTTVAATPAGGSTSVRVAVPDATPGDMALASFEPVPPLRAAMPVVEAGAVRIDLDNLSGRPTAQFGTLVRIRLMKA